MSLKITLNLIKTCVKWQKNEGYRDTPVADPQTGWLGKFELGKLSVFGSKFPGKTGWLQDIMSNAPLSSTSAVKVSLCKALNHRLVPLELFSGYNRNCTELLGERVMINKG